MTNRDKMPIASSRCSDAMKIHKCLIEEVKKGLMAKSPLTLSGPEGAQWPGWPNSQLPIRNLLSYDAQTW